MQEFAPNPFPCRSCRDNFRRAANMPPVGKSSCLCCRLAVLIAVSGLVGPPGFGQGPSSTSSGATLTLAEREKLARPLLLHAESFAASLGPSDQTLLLYRTGGAWLALDQAHAIRLYREAFASALKFEPVSLRSMVQETILNEISAFIAAGRSRSPPESRSQDTGQSVWCRDQFLSHAQRLFDRASDLR